MPCSSQPAAISERPGRKGSAAARKRPWRGSRSIRGSRAILAERGWWSETHHSGQTITAGTRPEPRQYTLVDLERARDRVEAAQRRVDNDRTSNSNRGRTGLERAQLNLYTIENYAGGASLNDGEARSRENPRIATCYDKLPCVCIATIIAKAQLLITIRLNALLQGLTKTSWPCQARPRHPLDLVTGARFPSESVAVGRYTS